MMYCTAFYEALADIMITLTNPLWIGTAVRGQVWRATMRLEGSYPTATKSATEATVVIKIFLQSALLLPDLFDGARSPHSWMKWYTGAEMARSEAGDYQRMSALQGKEIPWSFGWYQAGTTPPRRSRSCPCHGVRHRSDCRDEVSQMMDGWLSCLYETTNRGVVVRDISARNILVRRGTPQPVVFTEFVFGRNSDAKSVASNITNSMSSTILLLRELAIPDGGHQGTTVSSYLGGAGGNYSGGSQMPVERHPLYKFLRYTLPSKTDRPS
ncbi:hypothetical protein BKA93DRAFT_880473 [Sparassis latifolia]